MRIINFDINSRLELDLEPVCAAIGFFDGLHKGHMQLVSKAKKEAAKKGLKSALITFSPSPVSVLTKQKEQLLTSVSERIQLASKENIDAIIILKFTKDFSKIEPEFFYDKILKPLNIKHLVSGEDFRFGHLGKGSITDLKKINEIDLTVVSEYNFDSKRISSSRIKENIKKGDMETANQLLGYIYQINGFVKHGNKKGRTIGFPTLNLDYHQSKIIPKDGVYVGVSVIKGRNYISTINIGHNPTVNTVINKSIESFVHNYNQDTYGEKVTFKIIKRIRDEVKFTSVKELISQMNKDIKYSNDYFNQARRGSFDIEII